jgi:aminopeptidase N
MQMDPLIVDSMRKVLESSLENGADKAFFAKVLDIPAVGEIVEEVPNANPIYVYEARKFVRQSLASELKEVLWKVVKSNDETEYNSTKEGQAKRAIKNGALALLAEAREPEMAKELLNRCKAATNMTDRLSALSSLNDWECNEREQAHAFFKEKYKDDQFVMTSWLGLQGNANVKNNLTSVQSVIDSDVFDFSVPNHVFSLIGGFASSAINFHAEDGSGYKFLTNKILELDKFNPSAAARMVKRLVNYRNYDSTRQSLMLEQLRRMYDSNALSANCFELVKKALSE